MAFTALQNKIRKLIEEKNAILLVHYYQRGEIHDIADILGDSLMLSMGAAKTKADIIVFAGVHFMAESASIICPDKTVLLPRMDLGCPLADMIDANQLEKARKEYPGVPVITYINSSACTKAHSDIICTSSNAIKVVNSFDGHKKVMMVPDGNLADHVAKFTDKEIISWDGFCPVHHFLSAQDVKAMKAKHPKALVAAHPECQREVLEIADFVGGTGGILRFAREADYDEMIIGTEMGILYQLRKQNPDKTFILASEKLICESMKNNTLEDIYSALTEMKHVIKVPEEIRIPAKAALDRMLAVS